MYRYIAVATVALLAACGDAATAPKTSANVQTSNGASPITVVPITDLGAYVSVRVADTTGTTTIENPWVKFTAGANDTVTVLDNSAKDADPTVGVVKVVIKKTGSYTACLIRSAHLFPDFAGTPWPSCKSVSSSSLTVALGTVYGQHAPQIALAAMNQFGARVGGGTYSFTDVATGWSLSFQDNNASYDESSIAGLIWYTLGFPRKMKVCQVSAPNGNDLVSDTCKTLDITRWGVGYAVYFNYETQVR